MMHKHKLLLTLLLLIVATLPFTLPVTAQQADRALPLASLTELAARVPGDAPMFVSFRTDAAYFETLLTLVRSINSRLNLTEGEVFGFPEGFPAWLGSSGAIVVPDLEAVVTGDDSMIYLFQVTDPEAAEQFIRDDLNETDLFVETRNGVTYFSSRFSLIHYALTDELLLRNSGSDTALLERFLTSRPAKTLAENSDFLAAQVALPEEAYNIFGYLDLREVLRTIAPEEFLEFRPDGGVPLLRVSYAALADALGVQAFGATILEERALTLDVALLAGSTTFFEAVGLPAPTSLQNPPVDLTLAGRIPANALVYSASTNTGSILRAALDDLVSIGDPLLQDYLLPALRLNDPATAQALAGFRFNAIRTFIELTLEGTLGLPVDTVYNLLDGQGAGALFVVPDANTFINLETVQFYANGDTAGSAALVAGFARLLRDFRVDHSYEGDTITLPTLNSFAPLVGLMNPGSPTELYGEDTVITAHDGMLIGGNRPAVEFVITPSGDSLAASAAWAFDARLFLPGAQSIIFFNIPALRALVAEDTQLGALIPASDRPNVDAVLGVFDSMAASSLFQDGALKLRLTLTLAK